MKQSNKQLKKAIQKTIKFFETHKWGQGRNYEPSNDSYCLMGAFRKVNTSFVPLPCCDCEEYPIVNLFNYTFENQFEVHPIQFNDRPHQKKQRVIQKLQKLHDLL